MEELSAVYGGPAHPEPTCRRTRYAQAHEWPHRPGRSSPRASGGKLKLEAFGASVWQAKAKGTGCSALGCFQGLSAPRALQTQARTTGRRPPPQLQGAASPQSGTPLHAAHMASACSVRPSLSYRVAAGGGARGRLASCCPIAPFVLCPYKVPHLSTAPASARQQG